MTWQQAHMYSDILTLWRTTIDRNPDSWMAHTNLGAELDDQGRSDEAMAEYQTALRINPKETMARNNLGMSLAQMGRVSRGNRGIGKMYCKSTPIMRRQQQSRQTHSLRRAGCRRHSSIGRKRCEANRISLRHILILQLHLLQAGRFEEAAGHYEQVLRLHPDDGDARRGLEIARRGGTPQPGR